MRISDSKIATVMAEKLKSSDITFYNGLVDTYYVNLCTYAHTLTHDYGIAEDIVQNVFADIWLKRRNINSKLSLKNYLYRSVYNSFIDQYRKNRPIVYLEKKYFEAIDLVVEDDRGDISELIKLIEKEINNLPPKCKRIFLLNKKDGLTHTEISEYLKISIKTVEGHINRAFKRLQENLGKQSATLLFLLFGFENIVYGNAHFPGDSSKA